MTAEPFISEIVGVEYEGSFWRGQVREKIENTYSILLLDRGIVCTSDLSHMRSLDEHLKIVSIYLRIFYRTVGKCCFYTSVCCDKQQTKCCCFLSHRLKSHIFPLHYLVSRTLWTKANNYFTRFSSSCSYLKIIWNTCRCRAAGWANPYVFNSGQVWYRQCSITVLVLMLKKILVLVWVLVGFWMNIGSEFAFVFTIRFIRFLYYFGSGFDLEVFNGFSIPILILVLRQKNESSRQSLEC